MADGDAVDLGRWSLTALATPGHTPEHLAYLLAERGTPRAVFTGGSLLVGSVARTDLIDPADTEGLTRALWRSINHRLLSLPDDVAVLPTHGAGSVCTAAAGSRRWSTVGDERRTNPLLQANDEDDFVQRVLSGLGSFPPYFLRLREVNRRGPRVHASRPVLAPMSADQVHAGTRAGAVVVDVRPVDRYAASHVAGSLSNVLRPQFASWLGWMVADPASPLVFVVDEHTDTAELVRQCLNVGYENLAGSLDMATWTEGGGAVASTDVVTAEHLHGRRVLDVRQAPEYRHGHVAGAVHLELGSLPAHAGTLGSEPLVVMCGHGERAATAASVLEAAGHPGLAVLDGGPADWARATDRPLER